MEEEDDFAFEDLLKEHKTQQEFKSSPSRIIQIEGLRASVLHMIKEKDKEERKPTEKEREDRDKDLGRDKNIQRGRSRERERDREDDMSIFDETSNKELHDKLYKLFSQFGTVTYVNENLLLSEDWCFVFFSKIRDAQEAKEEIEKDLRKHLRPILQAITTLSTEPDWAAIQLQYEEPKTVELPINVAHKSSRHLWVGSIDDTVVTSAVLESVFSAFGILTDRPHINVGRQQGFVDFQTVYEAVDALCNLNGAYLGCLPLEIRFGRQEYGKVLWVGGLDERVTERELWQGCFEWGVVKSLFVHNNRQSASITFNTPEEAQTALDMLQGVRIGGCKLKVDYFRTARSYGAPEIEPVSRRDHYHPGGRPKWKGGSPPGFSGSREREKDREREMEERERDRSSLALSARRYPGSGGAAHRPIKKRRGEDIPLSPLSSSSASAPSSPRSPSASIPTTAAPSTTTSISSGSSTEAVEVVTATASPVAPEPGTVPALPPRPPTPPHRYFVPDGWLVPGRSKRPRSSSPPPPPSSAYHHQFHHNHSQYYPHSYPPYYNNSTPKTKSGGYRSPTRSSPPPLPPPPSVPPPTSSSAAPSLAAASGQQQQNQAGYMADSSSKSYAKPTSAPYTPQDHHYNYHHHHHQHHHDPRYDRHHYEGSSSNSSSTGDRSYYDHYEGGPKHTI